MAHSLHGHGTPLGLCGNERGRGNRGAGIGRTLDSSRKVRGRLASSAVHGGGVVIGGDGVKGGLGGHPVGGVLVCGVGAPLVGGADVLKDAQHGGHASLVVVGALGAGGEELHNAGHGKEQQRKSGDETKHPQDAAEGLGQEGHDLEEGGHGHGQHAPLAEAPGHGQVRREGRGVDGVLVRGVVVGDDNDGADALLDQRALALVEGYDVLAARGGAELLHKVIAQVASHKGRHGERHQHKADDGQRHDTNAHQQHAHKEHGKQNLVHDAAKGLGVKLFDGRLHAVSAHDVRDGLCGLVLLLAVCRSNPDVLVELVQVVMCHGHAVRPFGKSLMRLVRCCIQSRQYTAYGAHSLKTRRYEPPAALRGK